MEQKNFVFMDISTDDETPWYNMRQSYNAVWGHQISALEQKFGRCIVRLRSIGVGRACGEISCRDEREGQIPTVVDPVEKTKT